MVLCVFVFVAEHGRHREHVIHREHNFGATPVVHEPGHVRVCGQEQIMFHRLRAVLHGRLDDIAARGMVVLAQIVGARGDF